MAVKIQTSAGTIEITNDVIATVVGGAATDVFGVVGMASKNQIKDNITEILRKNYIHIIKQIYPVKRSCLPLRCYERSGIFKTSRLLTSNQKQCYEKSQQTSFHSYFNL